MINLYYIFDHSKVSRARYGNFISKDVLVYPYYWVETSDLKRIEEKYPKSVKPNKYRIEKQKEK